MRKLWKKKMNSSVRIWQNFILYFQWQIFHCNESIPTKLPIRNYLTHRYSYINITLLNDLIKTGHRKRKREIIQINGATRWGYTTRLNISAQLRRVRSASKLTHPSVLFLHCDPLLESSQSLIREGYGKYYTYEELV